MVKGMSTATEVGPGDNPCIAQDPNPYLDLRARKDRGSLQLANGPLLRAYCVLGLLCMMGSRPFL